MSPRVERTSSLVRKYNGYEMDRAMYLNSTVFKMMISASPNFSKSWFLILLWRSCGSASTYLPIITVVTATLTYYPGANRWTGFYTESPSYFGYLPKQFTRKYWRMKQIMVFWWLSRWWREDGIIGFWEGNWLERDWESGNGIMGNRVRTDME